MPEIIEINTLIMSQSCATVYFVVKF